MFICYLGLCSDAIEKAKELRARARRIVNAPCCMSGCLLAISETEALQLVTSCIREVDGLSPPEKKLLITEKIREGSAGRTEGGYLKVRYKVGVGSNEYMDHVCPKLFARCYEISSRHLDRIRRDVRYIYVV